VGKDIRACIDPASRFVDPQQRVGGVEEEVGVVFAVVMQPDPALHPPSIGFSPSDARSAQAQGSFGSLLLNDVSPDP